MGLKQWLALWHVWSNIVHSTWSLLSAVHNITDAILPEIDIRVVGSTMPSSTMEYGPYLYNMYTTHPTQASNNYMYTTISSCTYCTEMCDIFIHLDSCLDYSFNPLRKRYHTFESELKSATKG